MSTRTVHPNSYGISPGFHMCCTMFTRHIQPSVCRGGFEFSPGYIFRSHCLKCSAWRWVCPPVLIGRRQQTLVSTSAYDEVASFILTGFTCVANVGPGVCA